MLVMPTDVLPTLVSVAGWVALVVPTNCVAKVMLVGVRVSAALVPVPVRATTSGLLGALSEKVSVPLSGPLLLGVNVTETLQVAPIGSVVPQVLLLMAKSVALVPPMAIELMVSATPLLFVSVTVRGPEVLPTVWVGNASAQGQTCAPRTNFATHPCVLPAKFGWIAPGVTGRSGENVRPTR